MDKELQALKQSLDHTALRHLDFKERNKQFVRAAIDVEKKRANKKKLLPLKYAFSIAASFVILVGALSFVMHSDNGIKNRSGSKNNKQSPHAVTVAPKKDQSQYNVVLKNGTTSMDVQNKILNHYNLDVVSLSHEYKTADGQLYEGTYTFNPDEAFSQGVNLDQDRLVNQIQHDIVTLNGKIGSLNSQLKDPNSKGLNGVNQENLNKLEAAVKDRRDLLNEVKQKPLSLKSITINMKPNEVSQLKSLSIVTSIENINDENKTQTQTKDNKDSQNEQVDVAKNIVNKVDMMNMEEGWATTTDDILKTSDGGRSWVLDDPKGLKGNKITSSYFLNTQVAKVFVSMSDGSTVLFETSNGGKDWLRYAVPFSGGISPEFITENSGWVLCKLNSNAGELYKTSDGGKTWIAVPASKILSNPDHGTNTDLTMINNKTGWLVGSYQTPIKPWLIQTSDGGKTWVEQKLPKVDGFQGIETKPVKVFGAKSALLPAEGWQPLGQSSTLEFYRTTNNGKTWASTKLIKPLGMTFAYDFINMNDGWVIDYKYVYTTHNGGVTWSKQPYDMKGVQIPQASYVIKDLEMTSVNNGVMLVQDTRTNEVNVLITSDGGKNWVTSKSQNLFKQLMAENK